jgi:hydrogenase expression/formation protein HypD
MEAVARTPGTRIEGYLAAGHAATITGWGVFEDFAARHARPVVVAGFEPLDLLAGLCALVEELAAGRCVVVNAFPRCVTREGNRRALAALWRVFCPGDGAWRGIAQVPGGELELRGEFAAHDARRRFAAELAATPSPEPLAQVECRCGAIMTGLATPPDCRHFGRECRPATPLGACMVSSEGACRIWLEHGVAVPA